MGGCQCSGSAAKQVQAPTSPSSKKHVKATRLSFEMILEEQNIQTMVHHSSSGSSGGASGRNSRSSKMLVPDTVEESSEEALQYQRDREARREAKRRARKERQELLLKLRLSGSLDTDGFERRTSEDSSVMGQVSSDGEALKAQRRMPTLLQSDPDDPKRSRPQLLKSRSEPCLGRTIGSTNSGDSNESTRSFKRRSHKSVTFGANEFRNFRVDIAGLNC